MLCCLCCLFVLLLVMLFVGLGRVMFGGVECICLFGWILRLLDIMFVLIVVFCMGVFDLLIGLLYLFIYYLVCRL